MTRFSDKNKAKKPGTFHMELTVSARGKNKPDLQDEEGRPLPVSLYYPEETLKHFQKIIKDSQLCGQAFYNPFTEEMEQFPEEASEFTARHLQLLARNERINTTGVMKCALYGGLITEDQIARIRCLVKQTLIVGKVTASHRGGYSGKQIPFDKPEEVILIDQSGYQWQQDFHNTGGLYFYPDNSKSASLPPDYQKWQEEMYLQVHGEERPAQASAEHSFELSWNAYVNGKNTSVRGVLDLDALQKAFQLEFDQAFCGLLDYSQTLSGDTPINFKFLKAGLGFFMSGLGPQNEVLATLELARLQGILSALSSYPDGTDFGRVKRLTLPFSNKTSSKATAEKKAPLQELLNKIEAQCERLHLEWGGAERTDALTPTPGFITATTNCGDPHAMIGNEGGHASVDASLSTNIPDIYLLNPAYNKAISCVAFPESTMVPALVDITEEENSLSESPWPESEEEVEEENPWLVELNTILENIKAKEGDLRDREHTVAADRALALYTRVDTNRKNLINGTMKPSLFQTDSLQAIEDFKEVLEQHRETKGEWGQILGNLALAILGLGAFYLAAVGVNYALNGRCLFFPPATAGHLDNLRKHLKSNEFHVGDFSLDAPS